MEKNTIAICDLLRKLSDAIKRLQVEKKLEEALDPSLAKQGAKSVERSDRRDGGAFSRLWKQIVYSAKLRQINQDTKAFTPQGLVLIPDVLEDTIDRFGGNTAFIFEGARSTYADLEARANRVAAWGQNIGLKPGDTVALFMDNRPDYVAVWFGLSKIGVVTALINSHLSGAGLTHCLNVAEAKAIITCQELNSRVQDIRADLADSNVPIEILDPDSTFSNWLETLSADRPDRSQRGALRGKDVALLIYTSGTTGLPKAAKMTHARCLIMMRSFATPCQVGPDDVIYETLPLYHGTTGVCGVGIALTTGAAILLRRKFSASAFWDEAREFGATMFIYVGELGRFLMNQPPSEAEQAHKMTRGLGNGMRPDVWRQFENRTGIKQLFEFYGSTEGNISLINLDGTIGSVGCVPPIIRKHMLIRIIKTDPVTGEIIRTSGGFCVEAEVDEPGEAIGAIKQSEARNSFEGYRDKSATEKKILRNVFESDDAWFRSGDLMRRDRMGRFYFVDRVGDTFRWKSENVSTTEVTEIMSHVPGVTIANVFGVPVPGFDGKAGMAAVSVDEAFSIASVYEEIAKHLPTYARPVFVRVVDGHDTTGTLKLSKVDLVKQGIDGLAGAEGVFILDERQKSYRPYTICDRDALAKGALRL